MGIKRDDGEKCAWEMGGGGYRGGWLQGWGHWTYLLQWLRSLLGRFLKADT